MKAEVVLALAVLCPFAIGLLGPTPARGEMTLIELPSLGGPNSSPSDLNNTGLVVGLSWLTGPPYYYHAFSFARGVIEDLGTLSGGQLSYARRVNEAGVVVGASDYDPNSQFDVEHAFRCADGHMIDLGDLGGGISDAFGINSVGTIVGAAKRPDGAIHACMWPVEGGIVDLGVLGMGTHSVAEDINDHGVLAGWSGRQPSPTWDVHACMWTEGRIVDLGTLGGGKPDQSAAHAVNNAGLIVGESTVEGGTHAFVWTAETGMVDLGVMYDGSSSCANDINSDGIIAGYHTLPDLTVHASLYAGGHWVDLHALYFPSSWVSSEAKGINDLGWVVGVANDKYGREIGWVLVPEPGTFLLLVLGGLGLMGRRLRRAVRSSCPGSA